MTKAPVEAPVVSDSRPRTTGDRERSRTRRREAMWGYLLLVPALAGLTIFYLWPAVQTFYFSFTTWLPFGGHYWSGLDNYREVFGDDELGRAFVNTLIYTAITVAGIPIALVIAVLLNRKDLAGRGVYRVLYFLPSVTLPAAVALTWRVLYHGDYGVLNWMLGLVGVDGRSWLSDPATAMIAISLVNVWICVGYNMVLFLAGLQAIPHELYEAAQIDGAGSYRQFRSITLPLLTPTTFFVVVITIITTLQAFDLVYLMIGRDNPALASTKTIVYLFYDKGIVQNNGGYAAAIAFVLLSVILVATLFQFRLQKRWVFYD